MRQAPAFEDHGGRPAAGRALTGGWHRGVGSKGEVVEERGREREAVAAFTTTTDSSQTFCKGVEGWT